MEAFKLGTRVLAFDKRRIDPHAPHRFGATAVYDLPLKHKLPIDTPDISISSITIDRFGNNEQG